jgi:hypothetical protein
MADTLIVHSIYPEATRAGLPDQALSEKTDGMEKDDSHEDW